MDQAAARVRWLVAGTFTASSTGRRFVVSTDSFAEEMARAVSKVQVTVPDRLGQGETRSFELSFPRLRAFQLAEVAASIPELRSLRALALELAGGAVTRENAAARVVDLVGPGRLSQALTAEPAAAAAPEPAPSDPAPAPASPSAPADAIDALFSKAEAPAGRSYAQSAIDAFVTASRPSGQSSSRSRAPVDAAKGLGALLEEAVFATARDVLAAPPVARLESAWRGLKMLIDQCPSAAGMSIEILDVDLSRAAEAIASGMPDEQFERPDAIFVVDPTDDVKVLAQLAAAGERALSPVVAAVTPALIGAKDAVAISDRVEEEEVALPEAWTELRDDEASRWLCAAVNRVVLASETSGTVRRVCLGSPTFAIAAMLAASYRTTGAFARLYGRGGELQSPAVWEAPGGREDGSVTPIEAFLSIRAQSQLARLGVLGLGSSRNSDMIVLSVAPMARADEPMVPLSGQVLTGRVVRFALWVRDQLPPNVNREQVPELFSKAAEVFLFAGATDTGSVRGELLTGDDGKPVVQVTAKIRAEHAGMPFEVSFALPLRA